MYSIIDMMLHGPYGIDRLMYKSVGNPNKRAARRFKDCPTCNGLNKTLYWNEDKKVWECLKCIESAKQ